MLFPRHRDCLMPECDVVENEKGREYLGPYHPQADEAGDDNGGVEQGAAGIGQFLQIDLLLDVKSA